MADIDIKELSSKEHDVLGVDFCSGYSDIFGKWNTGFNCPRAGNSRTVYCCGTVTYRYCCTRRDHHSGPGISLSIPLGSAMGSMVFIIIVTLVSCLICRRCALYRRHHASLNGGPLYALHCSSTTSGMGNVYSFPCQSSIVTTPLDSSHVIVGVEQPEHIYAVPMNSQRGLSRHLIAGGINLQCSTPVDPPPSYTEASAPMVEAPILEAPSPKLETNISPPVEKEETFLSSTQSHCSNPQESQQESTSSEGPRIEQKDEGRSNQISSTET